VVSRWIVRVSRHDVDFVDIFENNPKPDKHTRRNNQLNQQINFIFYNMKQVSFSLHRFRAHAQRNLEELFKMFPYLHSSPLTTSNAQSLFITLA
jgi:hypothetical protein